MGYAKKNRQPRGRGHVMRAWLDDLLMRLRLAAEVIRSDRQKPRCVCEHTLGNRVIGVGTIEGACRGCTGAPGEETGQ